ncbi:MAG: WD40/YVTN/BNR-like repeat-containing protein [Calditrichia bacterium]
MKDFFNFAVCTLLALCTACSQSIEKQPITLTESLHDIEVLSDDHAIAYSYGSGQVYESRDGNISWTKLASLDSLYLEQIQFLNHKDGWLCGESGSLFSTSDGGTTWKNHNAKFPSEENKNLLFYGMLFLSEHEGYLSGMELNRAERKILKRFYHTRNGGENWENISETLPLILLNIEAGKSNELWGSGAGIVHQPGQGEAWETVFKDSTSTVAQIRDMAFKDDLIIAVAFSGHAIRSVDYGKTWTTQQLTSNRIRKIAYIKDSYWIAVGDTNKEPGNMFISHDDGLTWTTSEETLPDIHRISLSDKYIWMVGKDGFSKRMPR